MAARKETAEEVRSKHIRVMGPRLGPVYSALWNECAWLHVKWQEYRELYGTKPERINLLNSAASLFFRIVQHSLWEDTFPHLARLTDPPKSRGRPNLTLQALPALIDDRDVREEISRLVEDALTRVEFARDWRKRRIAHRDLNLALEQGAEPLAPASRKDVNDALSAVAAVLNRISERYLKSTVIFDVPIDSASVSLLYVLRDGVEAERKRRERLRAGHPDPDDLDSREV